MIHHRSHVRTRASFIAWGSVFCALVAASPVFAGLGSYSFQTDEDWLIDAGDFPAWRHLEFRHAAERPVIDACLADRRTCPPHLRGYRQIVTRMGERRSWDAIDKLEAVNRFINRRHWISDRSPALDTPGGWRTLSDFLEHGGDCEDYAIAKYFMLRELGFEAADLRIVFAYDRAVNDHHALLAVRIEDRALLLEIDNTIRAGQAHREYRFLFSINEEAVWDHLPVAAADAR